jgi:hypothetical protein
MQENQREMYLPEKYRLLARMFTRPVFAAIARKGDWGSGLDFLFRHQLLSHRAGQSLSDLFESSWQTLRIAYRNEYVYKSEIANRVVFGMHSPRTTALEVEFPVGGSIVDVAAFNGTSTAYEVKTEFDSSRRLNTQTADYLKAFDRVFVVAHPASASKFAELVDNRVGVLALGIRGSFTKVKPALSNAHNVSVSTVFRCLRRAEYVEIAESIAAKPMNYPNGLIAKRCEEHFAKLAPPMAHASFLRAMRARKTDLDTASFVLQLPPSLRALGYATPLSRRQRTAILDSLGTRINLELALN